MLEMCSYSPLLSAAPSYGDAVRELDYGVGVILDALRLHGLDSSTWWSSLPTMELLPMPRRKEDLMALSFVAKKPPLKEA